MNLAELSIKRPTLVVVVFTIFTLLGVISYKNLRYELFPNFNFPMFMVQVTYPGASPSEVENSVTKNVEDALAGVPGVQNIQSYSSEGSSFVMVELEQGTDADNSVNEASRLVRSIRSELPKSVQEPSVVKFKMNDMPIVMLGVNANVPASEFNDLMRYRIVPEFSSIPGVASATTNGSIEREIQVNVDPQKLLSKGTSLLQVLAAIQGNNSNYPAGKVTTDSTQGTIRLSAKFASTEDIRKTVIRQGSDGSLLQIGDVAEVVDIFKDPKSFYRTNGQPAVGISITRQQGANTVKIAEQVKAKIAALEAQYAKQGLRFQMPLDESIFIREAADSVTFDLILAVILVTVIMIFFLHSIRNGIIVMVAVPLSIITTFIGLSQLGFSLNLITLLALSLMIGTLVDDAIVVLENIYRHMEMGKDAWKASIDGIKEIGLSVTSITLVLVVVFLPISLADSMLAPIFRAFSLTVVISILVSLLVAFTAVPLMASRFGRLTHIENKGVFGRILFRFELLIEWTRKEILALLDWALVHRKTTLAATVLLFASSVALVPLGFIGSELAPNGDQGDVNVSLEFPKDISAKRNDALTRRIEADIINWPEVKSAYTTISGSSSDFSLEGGANKSQISMKLVDKRARKLSSAAFAARVEHHINSRYPGVKASATSTSLMSDGSGAPVQVILLGSDRDSLQAFAERILDSLKFVPGAKNIKLSSERGNPEVVVVPDREKVARMGLDLTSVGTSLQTAFAGDNSTKFTQGDAQYDIDLRQDAFNRRSAEDVGNLLLLNSSGAQVRLKQVATITQGLGPSQLERYARIPSIVINAYTEGRATGEVGTDILAIVNRNLPPSMSVKVDGELKQQSDAFGSLGTALVVSILLVYLIMIALYESYLYPFVVLFSIPFSIIGALWGLALSGDTLSLFSFLGLIMLVGLVVKNAILVVDFTNQHKRHAPSIHAALREAVASRYRPILMTAIATIVGMLPIVLSHGAGSEWKTGIGWVIIGGMTSSVFLSLIVVPVVYSSLEALKIRTQRLMHKREQA